MALRNASVCLSFRIYIQHLISFVHLKNVCRSCKPERDTQRIKAHLELQKKVSHCLPVQTYKAGTLEWLKIYVCKVSLAGQGQNEPLSVSF